MSNDFFIKVSDAFRNAISTPRLNIYSASQDRAEGVTDLLNAENGVYYTHTTGQDYSARSKPLTLPYVQKNVIPLFESGSGFGRLSLFLQKRDTSDLIGSVSVWQDSEGRTRLSPFVLPSKRRQGFMREAYDAVVHQADSCSLFGALREVWAEVSVGNSDSLVFYEGLGFKKQSIINTPAKNLPAEKQERFCLVRSLI